METSTQKSKLVVIVGPTASGKSALAIKVAKKFNGEIIAADSRTIYKGMNIGTAKSTPEEQNQVRHWGLNLIELDQEYSAADFKEYAKGKINDIQNRGLLPILVGGTGLYVDSVLFDFNFTDRADSKRRAELEKLSVEQLQGLIKEKGYKMPENYKNKRHLVRAVEREGKKGKSTSNIIRSVLVVGILPSDEELKKRISRRGKDYFNNGITEEVKGLLRRYDEDLVLKNGGIAYLATIRFLKGEISEEEARNLIQKLEWQYARRQRTWFRRNKFIHWFDNSEQAYKYISSVMNN